MHSSCWWCGRVRLAVSELCAAVWLLLVSHIPCFHSPHSVHLTFSCVVTLLLLVA